MKLSKSDVALLLKLDEDISYTVTPKGGLMPQGRVLEQNGLAVITRSCADSISLLSTKKGRRHLAKILRINVEEGDEAEHVKKMSSRANSKIFRKAAS